MPYNIGDKLNNKYWSGENYGWQSKATHEKLKEEGKFRLGTQAIDRVVSSGMDWATQNLPGVVGAVNTGLKTVGGVVNFTAEQLNKSATGRAVVSTVGTALETYDQALEAVSEATNIDKRVVGLTTDLAIGAVTGGSGTAAKLSTQAATGVAKTVKRGISLVDDVLPPPTGLAPALAGGVPMPAPRPQLSFERAGIVFKATTSPEWTSPKAGSGSAVSKQFAPAVETYKKRRVIYDTVKTDLKDAYVSGTIDGDKLTRALKKIGKHEKGVMSTFPYDEANPEAYLTDLLVAQPYRQERVGKPGVLKGLVERFQRVDPYDVTKKAQQHHVLAKAETKPFVDKLLELIDNGIGDDDDLVNFFVWSEKYDLFPGNVAKNLLDMGEITHTTAKQDPMALHKILDAAGLEFGSRTKPRIIKDYGLDKVKSADELMKAYDRYLQEIAVPSRDIAYKVQDWWYNKTIKTLKGKELEEFKKRFAELQEPRKAL